MDAITDATSDANGSITGDYREVWKHIDWAVNIYSTRDYVVFIGKDGELDWQTTPLYDERVSSDPRFNLAKHNAILNEAALLDASPCDELPTSARDQLKRLIGEAIGCSLDHDYIGGREMLAAANQYLRARSEETSRYWYLCASMAMAAPFAVLGCLLWIWRSAFIAILSEDGFWVLLASVAGALGATLSVISRSGNLKFDCSAGRRLHNLEATSRVWAGAISGVLVALAVKAELVLTALTRPDKLGLIIVLGGFAAGVSERLAPSIISKFEPTEAQRTTGARLKSQSSA